MDNNKVSLSSGHKEIIVEIGKQLNLRKWLIIKRSILIIWPIILTGLALYIGEKLNEKGYISIDQNSQGFILGIGIAILWGIFIVFYGTIIRHIFETEKIIWIDSFFDKVNLEPKKSWHMAIKLFWPTFIMDLQLFFRYYFLPVISYLLCLIISIIIAIYSKPGYAGFAVFAILLLGPIFIWVYVYFYIKIKVRFARFLFLDNYGENNFSYKNLFSELNELNLITDEEQFKKALVLTIGVDSVELIIQEIVGIMTEGLGKFGGIGEATGIIWNNLAEESTRQASSYAKVTAMYILYRCAREYAYKDPQKINNFIYDL